MALDVGGGGGPVRIPHGGWKTAAGILLAAGVLGATAAVVRETPHAPNPVRASRSIASASALSSSRRGVLLLATEANRRCLRAEGSDLDERLARWEDALRALDVPVRRVADLDAWGDEILLLVNVVCLSDEDVALIEERMLDGAGVFVAGGVGTRDEEGRWLGWERMHDLLGGPRESEQGESAETVARGRGRLAWTGVDPDPDHARAPVGGGEEDADLLLEGLLGWCAGGAEARVDLWPHGAEAVLLIIGETDRQAGNAPFLDRALEEIGGSGTYPFSGDRASRHAPLVRELASRHAIVLRGDGRGGLAGVPFGRQLARLRAAGRDLSRASGRAIRGACPPEEGWDGTTLQALASLGYQYVLDKSPAADALPETLEFEDARGRRLLLLRIPMTGTDDRDLIAAHGADDGGITRELLDGLRIATHVRGIHAVSIHADRLGAPDRINALARFLDHASMDNVWITSADSLAAWWRVRSKMSLSLGQEGETYVLDIENGSDEPCIGCDLLVQLPGNPASIDVDGADRTSGYDDGGLHRLRLGRVAPGGRTRVLLRISPS